MPPQSAQHNDHRRDVPEAYRLRAVGHSLGGASLLIYLIHCRRTGRAHHLYRLILLTPAGFLSTIPMVRAPYQRHAASNACQAAVSLPYLLCLPYLLICIALGINLGCLSTAGAS